MANKNRSENTNWMGDKATAHTGRRRAQEWFPLEPCEVCGSDKSERHHKDDDTLNNDRSNIQFLCRKHHMEIDGRLAILTTKYKGRPR